MKKLGKRIEINDMSIEAYVMCNCGCNCGCGCGGLEYDNTASLDVQTYSAGKSSWTASARVS